uniref:Dynein axonemal heavy chain 2 n=1 Tax=Schistosoma mansoni TaxID=6183 RepID=A0A3Q0KTZ4_SCHMA
MVGVSEETNDNDLLTHHNNLDEDKSRGDSNELKTPNSLHLNDKPEVSTNGSPHETESIDHLDNISSPTQEGDTISLAELIKNRICLTDFDPEFHWHDIHDSIVEKDFASGGHNLLICYMLNKNELKLEFEIPRFLCHEINYFIFTPNVNTEKINVYNFDLCIQYGSVSGSAIQSLLNIMSSLFAPNLFTNISWPDSIHNDFSLQLQRFMSSLNDTRWKLENKTVLYMPTINLNLSPEIASKDKELINRFEMIVIHWTRQIKTVLNLQNESDNTTNNDNSSPLDEINFWYNRYNDLIGINLQLNKPIINYIKNILLITKSIYLINFLKLINEIKLNKKQAKNNLKFLNTIKDLCYQLNELKPINIPNILPLIINKIRMIWIHSKYYNNNELIINLFNKLSNIIITRCCSIISLDDIYHGKCISSTLNLNQCIYCCEQYKEIYNKLKMMHKHYSLKPWDIDHHHHQNNNSIFAQIDAFIQRCHDLLEVCQCLKHFGRYEDGNKTPMPILQGIRGSEVENLLLTIEQMFEKLMYSLFEKRHCILNVKATSWHDNYNRFRIGVKDLEVMMQNAINTAFETVTTLQQGVEILDIFAHLRSRETIRRTIDNRTNELVSRFGDCLNQVKKEMTQRVNTGLPIPTEAYYSGQALYWKFLRRRLEKDMLALDQAFFLPLSDAGIPELRQQYTQLTDALDDLTRKIYNEFQTTIEPDPLKCLDLPVLTRSTLKSGMTEPNFSGTTLKLLNELYYWNRLGYELPTNTNEAYRRRIELKYLHDIILIIVRDYNRIINSLNNDERALFKERIKLLDIKLIPGLTKLHWTVKGLIEMFIHDCRIQANKLQLIVDEYKLANINIKENCEEITKNLLIKLQSNRIYENTEFDDYIINKLREVKQTFVSESADIQMHWWKYTEKMDHFCEEAFRINVKSSLCELQKAINGDGRNDPNPLFKVSLNLDNDVLIFSPTLGQLTLVVASLGSKFAEIISVIPRLPDLLAQAKSTRPPISEVIATDEEINKIQASIKRGMQEIGTAVHEPLSYWDQFREIWELPKDDFIQRYRQLNPHVTSIDADISRYTEVTNKVLDADTMVTTKFLQLDFSLLKNAIAAHCRDWQTRLINLLLSMTEDSLNGIYAYMNDVQERILRPPLNLDELDDSIQLLDQILSEQIEIQAKFGPLEEQFAILDKCEVTYSDEISNRRVNLANDWVQFQSSLASAEMMIKKSKEKFKVGLLNDTEEFKRAVSTLLQELQMKGPFAANLKPQEALDIVNQFSGQLDNLKSHELELRHGLNLFKIEQPPFKEISIVEKDLDILNTIWTANMEWENNWESWKAGRFYDLQTNEMENLANTQFRKFTKWARDLKDRNWEIIEVSRKKVDQFRRTLPLITDLRNPAMRTRHWDKIKEEMNTQFNVDSDEFTLECIVELGFEQYSDLISEISGAATKELAIEKALDTMERFWQNNELDMISYKDKSIYKIKSTDEIFEALEDDQVQLSTMKTSRFVKPFEHLVDNWERVLSLITETIETLLTVQRQYMYMETIFLGEDIRKQLPKESVSFDMINIQWQSITTYLYETRNTRTCASLLDQINKLVQSLEEIQQSLDMYLETKRQIFPRFYFISNDDLLEVLGQGRNPEAVMPHLKKCFDNITLLRLEKTNFLAYDALSMFSLDGEEVPFKNKVRLDGPVESWLGDIEEQMYKTLKYMLRDCRIALKKAANKRDKFVKEWPGQLCITSSQIQWTADVTRALQLVSNRQDKRPLKSLKHKQKNLLEKFSEIIRSNLTKIQRLKINALAVIEVHQRDIIDKLYKIGCNDVNAFDWLSQLRFYWEKEADDCFVRQTNTSFRYGYEYLGNSGRLVITPLTDRCYITLTTALHLHRGGSPKGPAGTGKTETTKDLGKSLGDYVIVVNCSEGLDYKSMGRMFAGLAQTGAWGCFDEFNRINIEVLSVVAQQILSILSALAVADQSDSQNTKTRFMFEGRMIQLVWSCGIFITMNPGYAGRTELPDNLKSMFRPIAMVVPDSSMIAEITLFAEGFSSTKILAKKVFTLYNLTVQQLSKQDHYDFGLRALVSVLRYAGKKKRANPNMSDEELLLLSLNDMNLAKLTSVDLPLFEGIITDLFPSIEPPTIDYSKIKNALQEECNKINLRMTPFTLTKVIQLYETKSSRHSVMIVGKTLSGKSTTWRLLKAVHNSLAKVPNSDFEMVTEYSLNPKSLSLGELYGEFNLSTNEWTDGVLSSIMRQTCSDGSPTLKWIIFDGPVDTLWIESMNSVMDDNKILTLINGERISMPEQVSLLFEVEDLSVASPATVSRCGMVYNDVNDLGWWPYVESWLSKKTNKVLVEETKRFFTKYIDNLYEYIRLNCNVIIPMSLTNTIISLCKLYDSLATPEVWANPTDVDYYPRLLEMTFQFCMIWSVACLVDEDGRKKVDAYIREIEGSFPNKDSIYEYYVDPKSRSWIHWEEKLNTGWKYSPNVPFHKILVPTADTIRYNFLLDCTVKQKYPALLVGSVGTGKTSLALDLLRNLDSTQWINLIINMSSQTTSNNVQDIIEGRVEKRTKDTFVPVGGGKMLTFMDDFNMPAKDSSGSQPPLELIRQWLEYGFWYDRTKQTRKKIKGMQIFAAMGTPGGGRMILSQRLQSHFHQIVVTFPTEANLKRIYGTMITQKLHEFQDEVKSMADNLTQASIDLYHAVVSKFLPTPTKIHYLFNLRDISKIFQGLLRASKNYIDTRNSMLRLWIHEGLRVFYDRLVDEKDRATFLDLVGESLASYFDQTYHGLCPSKQSPIFVDFMNSDNSYEDVTDLDRLRKFMAQTLKEYNESPGMVHVDLVMFRDAIEHTCKVVRVINQPRGNMLLIGIGGSGRQSLSRLAAYICEYKTFQVEVTKHYRKQEFREDLKKMYFQAGVENKPTVFLFTDAQVLDESFLEDINNMLSSGEVPILYKSDEFEEVKQQLVEVAKHEGVAESTQAIFRFFIERVRANLHIILCMSPIGEPFRNRIRMFPAFVNCTTIDWFSEWPLEALLEVSEKYLASVDININEPDPQLLVKKQAKMRTSVAKIFANMHRSVTDMAVVMLNELKRHNYITPTNYLEFVSGYKILLYQKRQELSDKANKLTNVEVMSVELEEAKKKVSAFQKECDDYLVVIVQQKREADEQAKSVMQTQEKIKIDEAKCLHMAELAQADLAQAMPALEAAVQALESLNKKDITEIKSYGKPPLLVQKVLEAVMILRGADPSWAESKRQLGEQDFIKQLINFDKDNISDKTLKRIGQYCSQDDFQPDVVGKVSSAAKSLCMWVRAMDVYGRVYRVVEPKRQRLKQAEEVLHEKQAQLAAAQAKLDEVNAEMRRLQQEYNEKMEQKEELRKKAEHTEKMLDRASKLVSGLAGEKLRWEASVADLLRKIELLPGDCLLASAFLSYMGPFLSEYREKLITNWLGLIRTESVPVTDPFVFTEFLADPTQVREWNIQGLPRDTFSVENGVIVTRGSRWPLMVDPQNQALKWIKSMEGKELRIIDLQTPDYMRTLEIAVQHGQPVLLQNVHEQLDQALDPLLTKSLIKVGGTLLMKLGDKEIEYNDKFRLYITTKLPNPHYTPEISSKALIVNFAVKQQGLEAQLLGIVVRKERPELEEQKDNLVIGIAAGKRKLTELEDEILRLLNEAQGSLLDDEQLVNTLQTSKVTSSEVTEQLHVAEKTEIQIDKAREGYRPSAQRSSILFFVLNDMSRIDPMYQFSLEAYIDLFTLSIDKSPKSTKLDDRITNLNDYHTYAVYRYTCRGLFERHKLLFSFHICLKILESAGKVNEDEYNFFLRGGVVLDRENQFDNPCTAWCTEQCWDNITELDKLASFHGIVTSFEQYSRDWNLWYTSAEPENSSLPGEWDNTLNEFQRMLIVRSLRPDRVSFCATRFIINNLGSRFVEPPVLDMKQVVDDSSTRTPLIFVLSPGVDPTAGLLQLADNCGMSKKFHALSLGQGQSPIATRLIKEGIREGNWIFLANCHLSLSWMPALDKIVEQLSTEDIHTDFRLWLSSSPNPAFPISILQAGIKMTTEPPKGLRSNMKRLYHLIKEDQFSLCQKPEKYKKLLFSLCYFHSVLLERKKFLMLGWNIPYEFNDSDFEVSEHLLTNYLGQYDETPWDALRYLIADINYGGHVTDDWDRRLLNTYISDYFRDEVLKEPFYKLSSLPYYYIPRDGTLNAYREFVTLLPQIDHPEAFGQHPNADITSQIQETRVLLDTLLSLQPQVSQGTGVSREEKVLDLIDNLQKQLPEDIDFEGTMKMFATDHSPLVVVLLQEIQRYNHLLGLIRNQLLDLSKGIQGLVVMSSELEQIFTSIFDGHVPKQWSKTYSSLKPLGSWARDLAARVELFSKWASTTHPPKLFWIGAFTFPTGFLTAVLQTSARKNNISVDSLSWEFSVLATSDPNILVTPKDGVYISNLYLQGAGWDRKNSCLIEAAPMELVCPMPGVHFKPVENKKKSSKNIYVAPCYYYPNRAGTTDRPSFMLGVELKTGEKPPEHWTKRSTALLMNLDV